MAYHFTDPTEAEIQARRLTLNKYGTIAQVSALLVLLGVGLYQWLSPALFGTRGPAYTLVNAVELRTPSEQRTSVEADEALAADEIEGLVVHEGDNGKPENEIGVGGGTSAAGSSAAANKRQGRIGAWLDTPLFKGWKESRRHAIAIGLWAVWIVGLVFPETGDDYLHLTKRFAQIAASLLPFHYLLGTPSRLSPLPKLFRVSGSPAYNPFHRFHAVLILGLLVCHASFYLNFYVQKGLLWRRIQMLDVIMGLSMLTTLTVMTVLARQNVRYNHRPVFVGSHVLGAGLICTFLFIHAKPARWYAAEAALVYVGVMYERMRRKMEGTG